MGAIAVDAQGDAFVAGAADSTSFPTTPGAIQPCLEDPNGFSNAILFELDPNGTRLLYSTFLGGNVRDQGFGIALDSARQCVRHRHERFHHLRDHAGGGGHRRPGSRSSPRSDFSAADSGGRDVRGQYRQHGARAGGRGRDRQHLRHGTRARRLRRPATVTNDAFDYARWAVRACSSTAWPRRC